MGHVFLHSPSDVFGSLISDTEEFLEDFQMNHRGSLGTNIYSPISQSPTTPPISPPPQFRVCTAAPLPLASAPICVKPQGNLNDPREEDETAVEELDGDRNALAEFNRKKAQHESLQ